MWVHPDLLEDEQWTTMGQGKKRTVNAISAELKEEYLASGAFTDSEEEPETMATHQDGAGPSGTRFGKTYLKDYTRVDPKGIYAELAKPAKLKRLRFQKDPVEDEGAKETTFKFDIIAQLANIPARVTLYELLRLSKSTREALREALADSESFLAQIVEPAEEGRDSCPNCHQVRRQIPQITFSPENMQVRNIKHNRSLYFTGYVGTTQVDQIQIDPGSALSVVPRMVDAAVGNFPPSSGTNQYDNIWF